MNYKHTLITCLAALALTGLGGPLAADEQQAECEVREHGDKKKGQSGPCLFSQRQGYIDIRLNNGKTYSLSPQGGSNKFRDQDGKSVKRTEASGNMHKYKWDHRNITVTFTGGSYGSQGHQHGSHGSHDGGAKHVHMENGGAELTGHLDPGESRRYVFKAYDGQMLYVRVAPRGPDVYYQIFNPDSSFLLEQMDSNREYRGQLWQNGEHTVEVINRGRDRVSYNVIFGID
jgi:hypothetical protein